jgi:alpha-mannosidase
VLTYLITTSKPGWWGATYSADLTPAEIAQTRRGQQQPELHDELMIAYGHGDGGGGPTARMLEDARQLAGFPGMPRMRLGTALDFLTELEASAGPSLPTWTGELYLELHRGTYTSQARTKRANRKMEVLLHDAEFLAAWASLQGAAYPHRELREAWELLCLNQFHDIIPGSSIGEVYADSARDYARIEAIGSAARDAALVTLDAVLPAATEMAIYNPSPFARSEVIELDGEPRLVTDVPAYGYLALRDGLPRATGNVFCGPVAGAADAGTHAEARWVLEHETIRLEIDEHGEIVRLLHKPLRREVLPAGARANVWQLFEDRPLDWDAWDIDVFYDDAPPTPAGDAMISIVEAGGLRGVLEIRRPLEASTIVQRVVLRQGSDRIDFETEIDWRERHKLLKVAFPVAVLSPVATYDVQWGNVERPTHRNTSWDWARFETCAHKWVDLSEGDFGVSLLNDCKYGHDINDNVIRLTALKGATFPDPGADLGAHRFTYSLLPHRNSWRDGTVREAYALNDPLIVRHPSGAGGDGRPERQALVSVSSPFVAIETVKRAEDDAGIVLRAYEFGRTRGRVAIDAAFPAARAAQCDLHESAGTALDANEIAFDITPFQIVTVRLDEQHSDSKP